MIPLRIRPEHCLALRQSAMQDIAIWKEVAAQAKVERQ
jgi:hypothetical protein